MTTRMFSTAGSRQGFISNPSITINQGGGNKKAGFPYMIGRDHWASIFIQDRPLSVYKRTRFPLANQSRPIGSLAKNAPGYWHIPGTGK